MYTHTHISICGVVQTIGVGDFVENDIKKKESKVDKDFVEK